MTKQELMEHARSKRRVGSRSNLDAVDYKDRISIVPDSFKGLFRKVWEGSRSRSARIKAKCIDCCCYQRTEVRDCTVILCPLWPIRPYQGKGDIKVTQESVEAVTQEQMDDADEG